jgi:hypothetical protein
VEVDTTDFKTIQYIMWPGSEVNGTPRILQVVGSHAGSSESQVIILDITHVTNTPIATVSWTSGEMPVIASTTEFFNVSTDPAIWQVNMKTTNPLIPGRLCAFHLDLE